MRRTPTTSGGRAFAHRARWLVPFLTVAALAAAAPASTVGRYAAVGPSHDATAHHTRPFATVGTHGVVTDRTDHRDVPTGWVPALAGVALLGAVGAVTLLGRRTRAPRVRAAFRRRAPPLLRTA